MTNAIPFDDWLDEQGDDVAKVKKLTDIIRQVSTDLTVYREQFLRASNFLDYSIKK